MSGFSARHAFQRAGPSRSVLMCPLSATRRSASGCVYKVYGSTERNATTTLDVEPKVHHVSILHDVLAPFGRHVARGLRALLAAVGNVVRVVDDLRADEAFFEVRVDDPGRLRRRRGDGYRPRADFLRPCRKVTDQAQRAVAVVDDLVEAAFFRAERVEE